MLQKNLQDPEKRARLEARRQAAPPAARTSTLSGPVTIPVIVHVVLPNPYIITEAQIDYFINRLNVDFSGLNADSANAGTYFTPLRGHSLIRFTRARRTPTGGATTGVERRSGNVLISEDTYQSLKHSSDGGLDPWDITKYYNLWIGDGGAAGLLGIAPTIGPGEATETPSSDIGIDGVCIDYHVFSNGCFSYSSYNMGRTAVHEIGHNFGLYHIFEGCNAGDDFDQLASNGQLPASLWGASFDDTPGQSSYTSSCLSGIVASDCSGTANPPGKMYQDFMDYTDDACYSMFTQNQVARMHYVLEFLRPGYLTTDGATPPASVPAVDVAPTYLVSPGGTDFNTTTCAFTNYGTPICAGTTTPRVLVANNGTSALSSVTVALQHNSNTPSSQTLTGLNVAPGGTVVVTFPAITLVNGTNTLKFTTSAPNGGADGVTANDVFTQTVNIAAPTATPLTENFEAATLPASWTLLNYDGDSTWRRIGTGSGGSTGSLFVNDYVNPNVGTVDDFRSPPVTLATGADSLVVSFDVAHRNYPGYPDSLQVYLTTNCGSSYSKIYNKGGSALATGGSSTSAFLSPTAAQWRSERISQVAGSATQAIVLFRNYNGNGNNIFVDNINVRSACKGTTITTQPTATQTVCQNAAVTFSVAATGNASLTYQWYKGTSPISGATSATYTIASAATTDAGTYNVKIKNACGDSTLSGNSVLTVSTTGTCAGTAVSNLNADVQSILLMPNAIRNTAQLRVTVARATRIEWTVIDAAGRVVKRFSQQAPAGESTLNFDGNDLATGSYQLVGDTNKGKTATLKFVRL